MRLAIVEGVLYAAMVGLGEFWIVADAVRLGSSPFLLAASVTLPQLVGALGAVGMLGLLRHAPARRPLVMTAVALQGGNLVVLGLLSALGVTTPALLVTLACLHQLFGMPAGTAWSSWFGEVVPRQLRGRWFGARVRWIHGTTFVAIVAGGLVLGAVEPASAGTRVEGGGLGYGLLYTLAGVLRLSCLALQARSWEPAFHPPALREHVRDVVTSRSGAGVLLAGSAMLFAVCVSTPYFAPHMLETLAFTYPQYLAAQGAMIGMKVVSLGTWGRWVDRAGALPTYRVAAVLVGLVPLPWLFADRAAVVYFAQAFSGVAWAGHEVSLLALTLGAVGPRQRAVLLTAQSVSNGVAQVAGGLLGTAIVGGLGIQYTWTFLVSGVGRLSVAILSPAWLATLASVHVRRGRMATRVVAWTPHGGPIRQLLPPSPARSETPVPGVITDPDRGAP
jgi:MFS family permease